MKIEVELIEQKYEELINIAKQMMSEVDDVRHSMDHINDVVTNTVEIIRLLPEESNINIEACVLSAYWHDVGRKFQDKGHGEISAKILKEELEKRSFNTEFINTCYNAIAFHTINVNSTENITILETLEGKIIRDADKIGYIGTGRWNYSIIKKERFKSILNSIFRVRNEFLSCDASREVWDKKVLELIVFLHNEVFDRVEAE